MYFSKISLSKDKLALQRLNPYQQKSGYYFHQLMWDLFSENNPDKKRDFLYRAEAFNHCPCFYVVSATPPCDNKGIWEIEYKEYSPKVCENEQLYFRLRANPRVCHSIDRDKKKYFDIVQNAWQQNIDSLKSGKVTRQDIMQEAGESWLSKKAIQHGFKVNSVIVENFCQEHFYKKQSRVAFSTLDFSGRITVLDRELFLHGLIHGIGAAKSFGCGLLMVRR